METQPQLLINSDEPSKSFKKFTKLLIWRFKPLQLFCFAQSSTIKENSGCFTTEKKSSDGQYCLLMVTESDVPTEQTVQKFIDSRFTAGNITILCYPQKKVSETVISKNRFFLNLYSNAQLLYSRDQLVRSDYIREFGHLGFLKKAERKYSHYMALVKSFFAGATYSFNHQDYPICVLMLHHATQQCLILLLRLQFSYQIEMRGLPTLIRLCGSFSDQPQHLFLSSEEDKRLFEILIQSSSEVYNRATFSVSEADTQQLYIKVSALIKLTKLMCRNKVEQLNQEAILSNPLQYQLWKRSLKN